MTKEQFEDIAKWQRAIFGEATALSKLSHLNEELHELWDELILGNKERALTEFADCFILLFGAADQYGMTYENICKAIDEKTVINKNRKWGIPKENGVVNHIKQNH